MKWFGDVVVCAKIQAVYFFHHCVARGDEDDRNRALLAQTAKHLNAAELGEHDVQQDHVKRTAERALETGTAIEAALGLIPFVLEFQREKTYDLRLVFNNQDAHGKPSFSECLREATRVRLNILISLYPHWNAFQMKIP
jgi:hypothetical protein